VVLRYPNYGYSLRDLGPEFIKMSHSEDYALLLKEQACLQA